MGGTGKENREYRSTCTPSVQRRANRAGLKLPSLERLAFETGPGLGVEIWISGEFPPPQLIRVVHCAQIVPTVWFMVNSCFLLGV